MKKLFLGIFVMAIAFTNLFSQEWLTDFDKAKKLAAEENKNILMVFSGSDWCVPCMKLEKFIWQSEEFKEQGPEHFVLLRVDFPKKKKNQLSEEQQKQNEKLAEKYNETGYFPMINIVDCDGKILAKTGYKDLKPAEFIDMLIQLEKKDK